MFSLLLIISIALVPLHAFKLHHRILNPSLPQPPFLQRAQILLDTAGNPRIDPLPGHFEPFAEVRDALYQLALDPQPGASHSLWLISSVKACHLVSSANEHVVLHLPYPGGTPFAFEYYLDSAPSDGSCPPVQVSGPTLALPKNITITTTIPRRPPSPELRVPPPLTATGDPIVQEPEKTFLQKYWLYILIALGALIITPAGEEGPRGS
ncbi:hypothetical protein BC827DRAFT_1182099 [Russula dissimulans]|nr:hypothetical protein BC827DRAFT_1182099 [Russula dissimulans]